MSLAPGTRLGAYEIVALLGAGGMGEVYRARDTKLKREVAIKILPDAFANDAERLARFQREAELLATLNHPNIAQIHGIENETGDFEAYVVSYPKADQRWQVSVGGGVQPRWRADGREIFYLSLDGTLMSVPVDDSSGLTLSRPMPLFRTSLRPNSVSDQYDVTMDGKRFIVVRPVAESGPPPPISAVINWRKTLSVNP